MRIQCPHCGERGSDEFLFRGAADQQRPAADASAEAWSDYVHLRDNPAGPYNELWQHQHGCRRWLVLWRLQGNACFRLVFRPHHRAQRGPRTERGDAAGPVRHRCGDR